MDGVISMENVSVKSLKDELIKKQKIIDDQNRTIHKLKYELNEFMSELYWQTPKNERNAGRKSIITSQLKGSVQILKNEGKTIKAIASELNISVGLVHKILHLPPTR